eukprot:sb/3462017/
MAFRGLNLHKADFELMNEDLSEVDWDNLQNLCDESGDPTGEKFKELIVLTVLQLAIKHCPKKSQRGKNGRLEPLRRRRRKLKGRIAAKASNWLSKTKSNIAPLKRKDGVLTTDNKEKADILQTQYCGAFSDPDDGDLAKSLSWVEESEVVLDDFDFSPEDIKTALAELDPSSAGPDGDIPAKILTSCRNTLCVPLFLLWEKSFEDGKTPETLKIQSITPIFKRGDKTLAVNYRPVSLTSNLLKTFERVMRNKLVDHLEENNLLPDSQHGFRKRRGCLTQLLNHMDNIFNELNSGNEVEVVYLDYSKAFDKIVVLNGRSISPSAAGNTRWKLPFIESVLLRNPNSSPAIALAISESWLKPYISDAQIQIQGYNSFRSDRPERKGGGCVLYVQEQIPISYAYSFSDRECSLVLAYSEAQNIIFSCVYRPPEASDQSYARIMDDLQHKIGIVSNGRCPEMRVLIYQRTMKFVEEHFLSQMVDKPTRGNNILDIILTNSPQYIAAITTEDSKISDHRVVECTLGFNPLVEKPPQTTNWDHMTFRGLNLHKADFELMNEDLSGVDWDNLQNVCDESGDPTGEKFKELIVLTVLAIKHCPKKSQRRKTGPLEPLKRRRRKLKARIAAKASKDLKTGQLEEELVALNDKIRQVLDSNIERREQMAIDNIKLNPRFFFSYAKRLSKTKSNIAPLKRKDGVLTTDNKEKADILQTQYCGAFSDPDDGDLAKSLSWVEESEVVLDDFDFSPEDIKTALAELDPSSAGPDGDIPAKILTSCRNTLCVPLFLLWEKSFEDGKTPETLKIQSITPIFKRGDKTLAVNYRPVSLTSNLLKTFERVMRNKLVDSYQIASMAFGNGEGASPK